MTSREELIHALGKLDPATFEEVVSSAYQHRHGSDGAALEARVGPHATPLQFAEWLARRHMSSDMAIERVVYLPSGAGEVEIRLLEVNRLLHPPEPDAIEPLDFTPDTGIPFKVFVADITMDQWERIKKTPDSLLPTDWDLTGHESFTRG